MTDFELVGGDADADVGLPIHVLEDVDVAACVDLDLPVVLASSMAMLGTAIARLT